MEIYDEREKRYIDVPQDEAHNWVPALPARQPPDSAPIRTLLQPMVERMPTNGAIDGGALRAMESGEKSTPVQRGVGAVIILVALLAAGLLIAWVLMQVGANEYIAAGAFMVCAGIGGWLTYEQVTRHSPAGVERDKSDKYENIRLEEIASQERIALRKIDVLERALGAIYGRDDRDR